MVLKKPEAYFTYLVAPGTLAVAHALSVVHEKLVRRTEVARTRAGVHLVVDNTSVVAGRLRGYRHPPQLDLAIQHLQRGGSGPTVQSN